MNRIRVVALLVLTASMIGCGSSGKEHVQVLESDVQGSFRSMIEVYDSIRDETSLRGALVKLKEIQDRLAAADEKLKSLGKLSSSGKKRVKNFQGDSETIVADLDRALTGAQQRMTQSGVSAELRRQYVESQFAIKLLIDRLQLTIAFFLLD